MPAPKQQKKKEGPRSAGRSKKDYTSLLIRAKVRRHGRVDARAKKLARLRTNRHGAGPLTEEKRRSKRLLKFGARRPATTIAV
jgi:hypothetical protein